MDIIDEITEIDGVLTMFIEKYTNIKIICIVVIGIIIVGVIYSVDFLFGYSNIE
tara:strand:- start:468 stop:629 length:162 start_codon:yes stop_codon:yes gene_type:complete